MDCKLILISGGVEETFMIKEGVSRVGRDSDNDIQLLSPSVSRHHAEIHNMPNVCELEDLETSNGTYLNGESISVAKMSDGDELRLGEARFRFVTGGSSSSDADEEPPQNYEYSDRAEMPTIMIKRAHHADIDDELGFDDDDLCFDDDDLGLGDILDDDLGSLEYDDDENDDDDDDDDDDDEEDDDHSPQPLKPRL